MKLKRLFVLFVAILLSLSINKKVNASNLPNWEFYPHGINYLSSDYFYFNNDWPQGQYFSANYIKVKPNTLYQLTAYEYQSLELKEVNIYFYDENKDYINMDNEKLTYENNYSFTTSEQTKYIRLSLKVELMDLYDEYELIDHFLALYEGEKLVPPYNFKDMRYLGPNYEHTIILPNQAGYFIKSFDESLTMESILEAIYAYDEYDGDITNNIEVVLDNYSANFDRLGKWDIIFNVSDSSGNTSEFILYISNVDLLPPVISGVDYYEVFPNEKLVMSEILNNLEASDNYDGDCSSNIEVLSDEYSENYMNIGSYKIVFQVSDSSGNNSLFTVNVDVNDKTPPVLLGPEVVYRNKDEVLTVEDIKALVSAFDNVDGDLSDQIVVEYDEYTPNANRYNSWEIIFSVTDQAGNKAYLTVLVEVVDNIPPVFLFDQNIINIDIRDTFDITEVINLLKRAQRIDSDEEVEVIVDEYSANQNQVGSYKIVLQTKDEQLKVTVNVIDNLFEAIEQSDKVSFWARLVEIIILVLKYIWLFLKGIFV